MSRRWNRRSVDKIESIFNSIRSIGFRRGPECIAGGIAGGMARRTGFDVWLARLLVLLPFLLPVVGLGLYCVVWVLIPLQDGSIPLEQALGCRRKTH